MTRLEPSAWCRDDAAEASWHAAFDFGAVSGIFKRFPRITIQQRGSCCHQIINWKCFEFRLDTSGLFDRCSSVKHFIRVASATQQPAHGGSTVDSGYVDLIWRFTFLIRMQLLETDLHTERRGSREQNQARFYLIILSTRCLLLQIPRTALHWILPR